MGCEQYIRSICPLCSAGCSMLVEMLDGRPIRIKEDPAFPAPLCMKAEASLEYMYHRDRLKHPLKRVGEKGEGKWEQISWNDALDLISGELMKVKDTYGAEATAFMRGGAKGYQDGLLRRFANVFGTPNWSDREHICHGPKRLASILTCGFFPMPEYDYPPAAIVVWGSNPFETNFASHEKIIKALDRGTKLVVIDPREIGLAKKADMWLRVRPGSDLALALGMLHVIVHEELYDKAFVDNWTVGFDKLQAHLKDYSPEKVADTTWIDAERVKEVARLYATSKPAFIEWGNALDHNLNSYQAGRAISIMRAITGNLEIPGGEVKTTPPAIVGRLSPEFLLHDVMPEEQRQKGVWEQPKAFPGDLPPQRILKAMLGDGPHRVRLAYFQGNNGVITYSNASEVSKALKNLDFLLVSDLFMTPTANLADVVLPAASSLEFDGLVQTFVGVLAHQKVAQVGDCWPDVRMVIEIAKRVGLREYFWEDEEDLFNDVLKPSRITFREFIKGGGTINNSKQYRSYEADGFATPSGKVEVYSSQLEEWGLDPLPVYYELPETPYSDPEMAKEYPLIFTSRTPGHYRHSSGRQLVTIRGQYPDPLVKIHPETAGTLGIEEGDWVYIENKRGRIKQKAVLEGGLDPRVVEVDYGWWFPEKGGSYGWDESNINILTYNDPPYSAEAGSTNLRSTLCKVYKAV